MTPKQAVLITVLIDYTIEHGYPPSIRNMAEKLGKGRTTVASMLHRLERQGLVSHEWGLVRTWRVK